MAERHFSFSFLIEFTFRTLIVNLNYKAIEWFFVGLFFWWWLITAGAYTRKSAIIVELWYTKSTQVKKKRTDHSSDWFENVLNSFDRFIFWLEPTNYLISSQHQIKRKLANILIFVTFKSLIRNYLSSNHLLLFTWEPFFHLMFSMAFQCVCAFWVWYRYETHHSRWVCDLNCKCSPKKTIARLSTHT